MGGIGGRDANTSLSLAVLCPRGRNLFKGIRTFISRPAGMILPLMKIFLPLHKNDSAPDEKNLSNTKYQFVYYFALIVGISNKNKFLKTIAINLLKL